MLADPFAILGKAECEVFGMIVTVSGNHIEDHSSEHLFCILVGQFKLTHGLKKLFIAEAIYQIKVKVIQGTKSLNVNLRILAISGNPAEIFGNIIEQSLLVFYNLYLYKNERYELDCRKYT